MDFLTTYALLYFFSQTENKPHHLSCHAEFIRYAKKNLSQTQKKGARILQLFTSKCLPDDNTCSRFFVDMKKYDIIFDIAW